MTAIVLAGGESRRMGRDKAFLPIAGRPVIELILDVLRQLFRHIIIVTNSPERYSYIGVQVVKDALEARGPLTGIYTGLSFSSDDYNFVTACDMPFLRAGLISYMMQQAEGFDAVVPMVKGNAEPLHAIYHKRLIPVIEGSILAGNRKISSIFAGVRVRYLTEQEICGIDPEGRSFMNLNTPEDYKEASCLDSECRN